MRSACWRQTWPTSSLATGSKTQRSKAGWGWLPTTAWLQTCSCGCESSPNLLSQHPSHKQVGMARRCVMHMCVTLPVSWQIFAPLLLLLLLPPPPPPGSLVLCICCWRLEWCATSAACLHS